MRAAPPDQEQVDEADASPDEPLPLVQDGSQPLAEPDRRRRGPGENGSQHRDRAVEERRGADLAEDRRPDQIQPVRGGLVAGGRERRHEVVAEQVPDDEHEKPHEREPDSRVAQGRPPGSAREPDRDPVEREHGDEQPGAERAHGLDAGLGGGELVRLHERDRPGLGRQLGERILREPELGAELEDQLVQVEGDDAVAGGDAVAGLVLQHVHELLVGDRAGVDEQLFDAWPPEQGGHALRRRLRERAGEGRTETLEVRREPLRQGLAHVDVLVQLVDRVGGDRGLHLRVLDDLGRRLVPGGVVEHLPLRPGGQDRDERENGGEDDERPDDDPTLAAERCSGFRSRGCHGFTVPPGGVGSIVPSG